MWPNLGNRSIFKQIWADFVLQSQLFSTGRAGPGRKFWRSGPGRAGPRVVTERAGPGRAETAEWPGRAGPPKDGP